jgi:oligopeptide transport system substrate-binding protein
MNARKFFLFGLFVMILFSIAACATTTPEIKSQPAATVAPTIAKPVTPKVLRIMVGAYPDTIDPQRASTGQEASLLRLCYEGLTAIDENGKVGPGAADKWSTSTDGTVMTFHIREGLKRADGAPMNASDFAYALKRQVNPRVTGKLYADIMHDVRGADELIAQEGKKIADADLEKLYANYGVQSDDAKRELTITFKYPVGFWDYIAYIWVTFPTDKASAEASPEWYLKPENHKCNGAFQITTLDEGKRAILEANPNYWRGKPKLDRIETIYVTDQYQGYAAYTKNEFDVVAITSIDLAQAQNDPKLQAEFHRYPSANILMLAFNNARKPFDDKNVRIAFSQALDREGWIRDVLKGIGKPYTRWIPPGVPGAQADKPGVPKYDPQAAVETLIKAGYGKADGKTIDCAKLGELKITYSGTAANHPRFQFIAGNFVRVFNCPVTLDPVEGTVLTRLMQNVNTNPQITRAGWAQDYPHPQNWLSVYWKCNSFAKRYGYCNPQLDALMLKADQTTNFAEAIKLYQQAEDVLLSDLPGAPTNYGENLFLLKPYVVGPKDHRSSGDITWIGEWGPIWTYDIDLSQVPENYPKK